MVVSKIRTFTPMKLLKLIAVFCLVSFAAASNVTAAETESKPTPPAAPASTNDMVAVVTSLAGSSWKLTDLCGEAVGTNTQASLEFLVGSRIGGSGGVNRFSGHMSADKSTVKVSPLMTTRMAGPPAAMELEGKYLKLLPKATALELSGDTLKITCAGEPKPLQFSRLPAKK